MLKRGSTIIELLIYAGLLAVVMLLAYQLFSQASSQHQTSTVENEIYMDGQRTIFDLQQTVKNANIIDLPSFNGEGNTLSLNSGSIVYSLDANSRIQKNEEGQINKLTGTKIKVENLNFQVLGPSTIQPTVLISFTIKGDRLDGGLRQENFQTAVTLR